MVPLHVNFRGTLLGDPRQKLFPATSNRRYLTFMERLTNLFQEHAQSCVDLPTGGATLQVTPGFQLLVAEQPSLDQIGPAVAGPVRAVIVLMRVCHGVVRPMNRRKGKT